jgi:hypothetical protein
MSIVLDGTNSQISGVPGLVLQVVNATYSTQVSTASGVTASTGLTASITPSSSTSKIFILATYSQYATSAGSSGAGFQIYRNASNLAVLASNAGYVVGGSGLVIMPLSFTYFDSPNTTSSTSYTIYFQGGSGGTATVQRDGQSSWITLMEIAA